MKLFLPLLLVVAFFFVSIKPAQAFSLGDLVNDIKNVFSPPSNQPKQAFTITSNVALAPGGDLNNNGQIDAGDMIKFTYTITNTTDNAYKYATLKTNINRNDINFIHNVQGTVSLNDNGKTITIPNLHIAPQQILTISFEARVNYNTNADQVIKTQAEFVTSDNKSVFKEQQQQQITAKKLNNEKGWSMFNFLKKQ